MPKSTNAPTSAEHRRLAEAEAHAKHWKRWGPYLAERAWANPREDYSPDGNAWEYFTHDYARSRIYRWTEDGILGICDNHQYLCFALAMWNGHDHILKERLFGLTGPQGNHGEDVKEIWYYLDATPTNSYLKGLYKYPQAAYPYARLLETARQRTRKDPEYELQDTGIFDGDRYFDIQVEYAKQDVDDIVIRIEVTNRASDPADLTLLPTLWFRNTWVWGPTEEPENSPSLRRICANRIQADHPTLGRFLLTFDEANPELLFTGNETNTERIWGWTGKDPFYKDAFHRFVVNGETGAVNPQQQGTKACAVYRLNLHGEEVRTVRLRLCRAGSPDLAPAQHDSVFDARIAEADQFYAALSPGCSDEVRLVQRQAFAGLFWSKQFYHFVVETWLEGDPKEPPPPENRKHGRNHNWRHLYNEDVISMPDKWEYPWYAAWDLAFHTVAIAPADPDYAKAQLSLFLREWYMHPNGQLPAYEWAFSDVNPPVHAWAAWRVFQIDRRLKSKPDYAFLERTFHKLLMNFTWWVNRKDSEGANVFEGGFLGLDNIGVFDRNATLPSGWLLEQADGSSWMAMYCLNMLKIALQLSTVNRNYEDIASKFFEHFLHISHAVNHYYGDGLWDEEDGFYYDRLRVADGQYHHLRVRSLVGITPLFACDALESGFVEKHPGFKKRLEWFIQHRKDLLAGIASMTDEGIEGRRLLSVANRDRLARMLRRVFDENEFLSPYGIRSLSRYHKEHPYVLPVDGTSFRVDYEPAESETDMFGGNSNWRGPVWFPMNFLIIEALQRLDYYYGDSFQVELPTGSGKYVRLWNAAQDLSCRLCRLFVRDSGGNTPVFGDSELFQKNPGFRDRILFYEYFHGDTGKGFGASHQTGWTGLVAKLIQQSGARLCP